MPHFACPQDVILRANNGDSITVVYEPTGGDTLATLTGEVYDSKDTDATRLVTGDGQEYLIWWDYERKVPYPGDITTADTGESIGEFHDAEVA